MLDPEKLPLRDIHLPDPVGWWPLAPGWWALAGTLLGVTLGAAGIWWWWRRTHLRRAARAELKLIRERYAERGDQAELAGALSVWCRRVLLGLGGAPNAVGAERLSELDALTQQRFFTDGPGRCLQDAPYRPAPEFDAATLLHGLDDWVGRLPARRNNV